MNLLARARAYAALMVALPRLGITVAEGQTLEAAIEARLASTPAAASPVVAGAATPTAAQVEAATITLLTGAGIDVAEGQTASAAIASFAAEMEGASARGDMLMSALTAAGIKPVAADPKVGLVAGDFTAALEARISIRAAELLASSGTAPVGSAPAADNTKPAAKAPVPGREIEAVAAIYQARGTGKPAV